MHLHAVVKAHAFTVDFARPEAAPPPEELIMPFGAIRQPPPEECFRAAAAMWRRAHPNLLAVGAGQHECAGAARRCRQARLAVEVIRHSDGGEWLFHVCALENGTRLCGLNRVSVHRTLPLWRNEHLYMCSHTGRAHVCGGRCDRLSYAGDTATCVLTGFSDAGDRQLVDRYVARADPVRQAPRPGPRPPPPAESLADVFERWTPMVMEFRTLRDVDACVREHAPEMFRADPRAAYLMCAIGELWKLFCPERYEIEAAVGRAMARGAMRRALLCLKRQRADHQGVCWHAAVAEYSAATIGVSAAPAVFEGHEVRGLVASVAQTALKLWAAVRSHRAAAGRDAVPLPCFVVPCAYLLARGVRAATPGMPDVVGRWRSLQMALPPEAVVVRISPVRAHSQSLYLAVQAAAAAAGELEFDVSWQSVETMGRDLPRLRFPRVDYPL